MLLLGLYDKYASTLVSSMLVISYRIGISPISKTISILKTDVYFHLVVICSFYVTRYVLSRLKICFSRESWPLLPFVCVF